MTTPVYGAHEAKAYYVVESTYGVTPTNPSMLGLATAENVEPDLNPGLIRVRGTGSRDLQTIRKGLRQVGLKIAYNLPSAAPIDFLLHIQTLNSLSVEVVYEKSTGIIDLLHTGCSCLRAASAAGRGGWPGSPAARAGRRRTVFRCNRTRRAAWPPPPAPPIRGR